MWLRLALLAAAGLPGLLALVPLAPLNLSIKRITSTEIHLSWAESVAQSHAQAPVRASSTYRDSTAEYPAVDDAYASKPMQFDDEPPWTSTERLYHRRKRRRDAVTTTDNPDAFAETENAPDFKSSHMMLDDKKPVDKPRRPQLNYVLFYEEGGHGDRENPWKGDLIDTPPNMSHVKSIILTHNNGKDGLKGVTFILGNLKPYTYYRIWVCAFYANNTKDSIPEDISAPSIYVAASTDVSRPSVPLWQNLTCQQPPGSLYLQWIKPVIFSNKIDLYTVNLKSDTRGRSPRVEYFNYSTVPNHMEIATSLILDIENNMTTYEVTMYASTESIIEKGLLINGSETEPYSIVMTPDCLAAPLVGVVVGQGAGLGSEFVTESAAGSILAYIFMILIIIVTIVLSFFALYRWGCTTVFKKCFPMSYLFLEEGVIGGNDGCGESGLLGKSELQHNSVKKNVTSPAHTVVFWGTVDNANGVENFAEQLWDVLHPPVAAEKFFAHTTALHADGDIGFSKEYELIQSKSTMLGHTSHHSQHPDNRHKNRYLNITAYDHSRVCLLPSSSCLCEPGREHRKSCTSKPNPQPTDTPSHCDYVNANFIDGIVAEIDPELSKYIIEQNNKRKAVQKRRSEAAAKSQAEPSSELWITVDESQRPHVQVCPKPLAYDGVEDTKNPFTNTQDNANMIKSKLSLDLEKRDEKKILSPGSEILASTCRLSINLDRKEDKQDDGKSEKSVKETKSKKRSTSADTKDIVIDKKSTSRGHSKNSSVVVTNNDSPSTNAPKIEGAFLNIEFTGIVDSERELQKAKELEKLTEANKVPKEAPEETLDDLDNLFVQIDGESYRVNSSWLLDRRRYIGTQGPTPGTLSSFWRMVWDHKVVVVVMITNLVERGRRKCDMYWPKEGTETYGVIQVTMLKEDVMATYTVRTFQINNTKLGMTRAVLQYHYTVWPDHGTPEHPLAVLRFREAARKAASPQAGAVLVHCSAGVGRTGTYIVLDAMLNHLRLTGSLNVFGFLCHVRSQRNFLVQTEEQYVFIHDALLEAIQSGDTEVPVENAKIYLKKLLEPFPKGYIHDYMLHSKCGLYGAPLKEKCNESLFDSNTPYYNGKMKRINSEECDFAMWNNVDDAQYNDKTLDECRNDIVSIALQEAKLKNGQDDKLINNLDINGDSNHIDAINLNVDAVAAMNGDAPAEFDKNGSNHNADKNDLNDISPELIIDDIKDDQKIIDFEDGTIYNKNLINAKDSITDKNVDSISVNSINLAKSDNSTSYEKLNGICAKVSEESKASSVSNDEVEVSSNENNSHVITSNNSKAVDRNSGAQFNSDNTNTITSSISSDTNNLNNANNFREKQSNYSPCQISNNQDKGKGYRNKTDDNYELLSGSGRPGGLGNISSDCFAGAHQFSCQKKDFGNKKPKNLLEHQFKLVTSFEPSKFHIVSACKQVNLNKNRRGAVLPIESGRVHLIPRPGVEGTDYINATWLQGHRSLREYVVTQHPLTNTITDLYRLLWDHSCQILVMLTDYTEDSECHQFWPTEKNPEITTYNYCIRFVSEEKHVAKRLALCDLTNKKNIQRDDDSSQDSPMQSPSSLNSNKGLSSKLSKGSQRVSPVSSCIVEPENLLVKKALDNDDCVNSDDKPDIEFYRRQSSTDKQDEERLIPKSEEAPSLECTEEIDELKKLNNEAKSDGYYFDKSELRIETMLNSDAAETKLSPKKPLANGDPYTPNEDISRKPQKSPSKLSLKSLKLSSPILKSPTRFKFDFGARMSTNSKNDDSQGRKSPVNPAEAPSFQPKFVMYPLKHMGQLREGSEDIGMDCVITTTHLSINSLQDDYELKVKLIECPKWLADLDYDENSDTDDDSEDEEYEMESKVLDYVIDQRLKAYKGVFGLPEYLSKCQDEAKNSPVVVVDKLGGARAVALCTLSGAIRRQSRDIYSSAKLHHGRRAGAWRRPGDIRALYEALAAYEHPPVFGSTPTEV